MPLIDFIFPKSCLRCHASGYYLCPECFNKLTVKSVKPLLPLEGIVSPFRYHGVIKDLISLVKFNFVTDIIPEISSYLADIIKINYPNLLCYWQEQKYQFVPIPLHFFRQNWRGFNQADLFSRHLALRLNLPTNSNLLIRYRSTKPQALLADKRFRRQNVESVFKINQNRQTIKCGHFILFDDVCTTGSTLKSAASLLLQSGASSVWALTLAG